MTRTFEGGVGTEIAISRYLGRPRFAGIPAVGPNPWYFLLDKTHFPVNTAENLPSEGMLAGGRWGRVYPGSMNRSGRRRLWRLHREWLWSWFSPAV